MDTLTLLSTLALSKPMIACAAERALFRGPFHRSKKTPVDISLTVNAAN